MIAADDDNATTEVHLFQANQALDDVDEALARLRVALENVEQAFRSARERGAWSS
jgi:uncharacterized protein YukE